MGCPFTVITFNNNVDTQLKTVAFTIINCFSIVHLEKKDFAGNMVKIDDAFCVHRQKKIISKCTEIKIYFIFDRHHCVN